MSVLRFAVSPDTAVDGVTVFLKPLHTHSSPTQVISPPILRRLYLSACFHFSLLLDVIHAVWQPDIIAFMTLKSDLSSWGLEAKVGS